jgi:hypothetical protein
MTIHDFVIYRVQEDVNALGPIVVPTAVGFVVVVVPPGKGLEMQMRLAAACAARRPAEPPREPLTPEQELEAEWERIRRGLE